jgi:tRNA (guanine-N7-)-methyltransferase
MPHITVKPFDSSILEQGEYGNTKVLFHARDLENSDELIGVEIKKRRFLLHIKKSKQSWLIKYDKVTRPLDVNLVKEAIDNISKGLNLDIINSNIAINRRRAKLASDYQKSIEDFLDIEFPYRSVSIEIGFGSGRHLLHQATSNPNELFIGIEIHTPSAEQVLRQIELNKINNIWIINYDARLLLEMIQSNTISKIFVHFPVPWDKKPHRRVISTAFFKESMRVLKKGGRLELRTDSHNYFWYSLEIFLGKDVSSSSLEIRKNSSLDVISKYEARWRGQERDIYDLFVTSLDESEKVDLNFDFSFNNIKYRDTLLDKIDKKPLIFEDFFIHFERLYQIDSNSVLIKVSFGNFDRPEHKYISIDSGGCCYFSHQPVKTVRNYKAHLKIGEYLHV